MDRQDVITGPDPGWYADPYGSSAERWWDGEQWTDDVQLAPRRRRYGLGLALAFVALLAVIGVYAAHARLGGETGAAAVAGTPTAVPTRTPAPTPTPLPQRTLHFHGKNTGRVGTIRVTAGSTLRWRCARCAATNFVIINDARDDQQIAVNALGHTSGEATLAPGTYRHVEVLGRGHWALTVASGAKVATAATPHSPYAGADTQNLGTITVKEPSILRWRCASCRHADFAIGNDASDAAQLAVSAHDHTRGETRIAPGTYHDVQVVGLGNWSFTLR